MDRGSFGRRGGALLLAGALLGGATSCGDDDGTTSASPPGVSPTAPTDAGSTDTRADQVEDATSTEIDLDFTAVEEVGTVRIPITVRTRVEGWDRAELDVRIEGGVTVVSQPDLSGFVPGEDHIGELVLDIEPGTADEPLESEFVVLLRLLDAAEVVDMTSTSVSVLSDDRRVWVGLGGPGWLRRDRLLVLLEAGDITQAEFDRRHEATYADPTPRGTVTELTD